MTCHGRKGGGRRRPSTPGNKTTEFVLLEEWMHGVGKYLTFVPGVIEAARQEPLDNMVVFRNQNLRLNFHHHHLPNTPGCDATITG